MREDKWAQCRRKMPATFHSQARLPTRRAPAHVTGKMSTATSHLCRQRRRRRELASPSESRCRFKSTFTFKFQRKHRREHKRMISQIRRRMNSRSHKTQGRLTEQSCPNHTTTTKTNRANMNSIGNRNQKTSQLVSQARISTAGAGARRSCDAGPEASAGSRPFACSRCCCRCCSSRSFGPKRPARRWPPRCLWVSNFRSRINTETRPD